MLFVDIVLFAAVAATVVAWWYRKLPRRRTVLVAAALTAVLAGLAGLWLDRWQAAVGLAFGLAVLLTVGIAKRRGGSAGVGLPLISGPLFTLAGLLAVGLPCLFPVRDLPAPSGEHAVGVRTFELTDAARTGVLAATADEPRRLLVRVWYPAQKTPVEQATAYFNALEVETTARGFGDALSFPPFLKHLRHVRTNAYEGAPLPTDARMLPTVIFSHGFLGYASQNSILMEHLASHGYVVYSVQHPYDAAPTAFPGGDVLPSDPALKDIGETSPEARGEYQDAIDKAYGADDLDDRLLGQIDLLSRRARNDERVIVSERVWLADRLFVHERLESGAVPDSVADVVAASSFERTGQMGMSFGGMVTGLVCLVDDRCAAGVNIDGSGVQHATLAEAMPQPFLMMHSDHETMLGFYLDEAPETDHWLNDLTYEDFGDAGRRQDVHRIEIAQAAHLGLTDFPLFMRGPVKSAMLGKAPASVLIDVQNDFVLAFFDRYLRDVQNGFPSAQLDAYADYASQQDTNHVRQWWQDKSQDERSRLEEAIATMKRDYNR